MDALVTRYAFSFMDHCSVLVLSFIRIEVHYRSEIIQILTV
jgi:hypothetical protein